MGKECLRMTVFQADVAIYDCGAGLLDDPKYAQSATESCLVTIEIPYQDRQGLEHLICLGAYPPIFQSYRDLTS